MANKENNNFKQAINELLQGKITTDEPAAKPVAEKQAKPVPAADVKKNEALEETVIGRSVVIEGNVRTNAKLVVRGEVTGSIVSTADIIITGKVGGAISGDNITLTRCEINDTITAKSEVRISAQTVINGDIKSASVINNGTINGNVNTDSITLMGDSKTVGDIVCKTIKINEGASLKGKLETV